MRVRLLVAPVALILLFHGSRGVAQTPVPGPGAKPAFELSDEEGVFGMAWSPDGKRLVAAGSGRVQIWGVETRSAEKRWDSKDQEYDAAWSPNGKWLATCAQAGAVHLRNSTTWQVVRSLRFGKDTPTEVVWRPDGEALAVANHDKVGIFERSTGKLLAKFGQPKDHLSALDWHPEGTEIVTGGFTNVLRSWDWRKQHPIYKLVVTPSLRAHSIGIELPIWVDRITSVDWSPEGYAVVAGYEDGVVRIWPPGHNPMEVPAHEVVKHPDPLFGSAYTGVTAVAWNPKGDQFASAGGDGRVRIWHRRTQRLLLDAEAFPRQTRTGDRHEGGVWELAWSPDGKWLAAAGRSDVIRVYEAPRVQ